MNETYGSEQKKPAFERRRMNDLSERELLERLFEMTCPSCDKDMIRQAAMESAEDQE